MSRRLLAACAALGVIACAPAVGVVPATATTHPSRKVDGPVAVTVPAPGAGADATVTVSRTTNLVNQTVRVSWAGFRPSSANRLDNSGDSIDVNTENPVRVYQCRGENPTSSSDCYGSPGFRGIDATGGQPAWPAVPAFSYNGQDDPFNSTPDGPANWQDNVTRSDGKGEVTIQLFTKRESAALGCDVDSPCSVVVVPNYGRPQGATEDLLDAPWAWERRTVVPLSLLPVDDACPLTGESLRVEGSPMIAHALASWRAKTCTLSSGAVRMDYTAIGEPQTRGDLGSATTDVGLLIDPLDTSLAEERGVVYAPVSITGLVIAFQIDDAHGQPVDELKLNGRLVAKLITGSYRSGGNPAVIDNPVNIFRDPEFLDLNPGVDWPGGAPGNHPLLLGDLSDTTLALTRWIAADPKARAFLKGKPDPWGMTVNDNYKNVALPFASFPLLDPLMSETFEPIQELDTLSRQLSIARFPGAISSVEGGITVVTKPPRQNPGRREVIGIIDAAAAAKFLLPTASLQNTAGKFVKPTDATLISGIKHSKVNPDGVTRTVDLTSKDPTVYPLSMLISAALSTKATKADRAEMIDMLDYVKGPGQQPGEEIGQLPEGHAPLTPALTKQVVAAQKAVQKGYQEPDTEPEPTEPEPTDNTGDGGSGEPPAIDPGGTSEPPPGEPAAGDAPPGDTDDDKTDQVADDLKPTMLSVSSQDSDRPMLLLPALGLFSLLALVVGPVLIWLSSTGRGPQWLRR